MERTRHPVGASGWLWVVLALAAMGVRLLHTLVDVWIVLGSVSLGFGLPQSVLSVLIRLLYTWWAWVFAQAVGGARSWLVGPMVLDVLWVGGNGLTIFECPPRKRIRQRHAAGVMLGRVALSVSPSTPPMFSSPTRHRITPPSW